MTGLQHVPTHDLLSDGTSIRIRQAGPDDREAVRRLYEGMSPEHLRLRFFSNCDGSARQATDRVTQPGRPGSFALVAEHAGVIVGLAEYEPTARSCAAEIALTVADAWQRRGIGTLLLEHLSDAARMAGISVFTAKTLVENHGMRKVFTNLGPRVRWRLDGPQAYYKVDLYENEDCLSAVGIRTASSAPCDRREIQIASAAPEPLPRANARR
ncbi:GNAT family N-acetyltransferase [Streptomyces umbrinus]|uniref:GNAT family N-acetyltransferase n=1 Tax=Streptomyces umbrinus TaxID=67370 RepID=UPI0033F831A4